MIKIETKLFAADNVGIISGKCIHVYRGSIKKTPAGVGHRILVSVRRRTEQFTLKKKTLLALVVRAKRNQRRRSGIFFRFTTNRFLAFHAIDTYRGTRIRGPLAAEIEHFNLDAAVALARRLV